MSHPSLGIKTAIFINTLLIFIITFAILVQTASINKPEIKKIIPMPKNIEKNITNNINK